MRSRTPVHMLAVLAAAAAVLGPVPAHAESDTLYGCLKWSFSPGSGGETVYWHSHCPKKRALAVHGKDPVVGKVSCKITVPKGQKSHRELVVDVHSIDGKTTGLKECRKAG